MTHSSNLIKLACVGAFAIAPVTQAAVVLNASTSDAAPAYQASTMNFSRQRLNDAGINIGRQGTAGDFHQAMVIPFQIPDHGMVSDPFESATFTFRLNAKTNSPAYNLDLYGLAPRVSSAVLPSSTGSNPGDFFMGGFDGGPIDDPSTSVVKLQDNIITSSSATAAMHTTDVSGGAALLDYLNAAYDGGNGVGQWVFLRLNADATPGGVGYYTVATANSTTEASRPYLAYTAIPEPSAALLGTLGVLTLLRRRRH